MSKPCLGAGPTDFPTFVRLSLVDCATYRDHYARLSAPCCDFSLNNLLIWLDQHEDLELSVHGACLVLRFSSVFENNRRRYSLFGTCGVDDAVREVLRFIQAQGDEARLCMVPEETAALIDASNGLNIAEERANADYVIDVAAANALEGTRYKNLRQRVNTFKDQHANVGRIALDLRDLQTSRMVRRSIEDWMSSARSRQNDPEGWEVRAIARHLDLATTIPVRGQGLFVDGRLVSVGIYHCPPQPGWVILNHLKCDYRYKDLFGYSLHQMIREAHDAGKKWLNVEQDLGKPGVRRAKLLLRPHHFLRRYSVSLA